MAKTENIFGELGGGGGLGTITVLVNNGSLPTTGTKQWSYTIDLTKNYVAVVTHTSNGASTTITVKSGVTEVVNQGSYYYNPTVSGTTFTITNGTSYAQYVTFMEVD